MGDREPGSPHPDGEPHWRTAHLCLAWASQSSCSIFFETWLSLVLAGRSTRVRFALLYVSFAPLFQEWADNGGHARIALGCSFHVRTRVKIVRRRFGGVQDDANKVCVVLDTHALPDDEFVQDGDENPWKKPKLLFFRTVCRPVISCAVCNCGSQRL